MATHKIFHMYKHKETKEVINLKSTRDKKIYLSENNTPVRKIDLIFHYEYIGKRLIKRDAPAVLMSTVGGREEERQTKSGFKYRVFIKE